MPIGLQIFLTGILVIICTCLGMKAFSKSDKYELMAIFAVTLGVTVSMVLVVLTGIWN